MVLQSPLPDWLSRASQGHHTRLLHFANEQRTEPPEGYQKHPLIRSQKTITFKVLSRERRARQALDTRELFSFYSPFKREEPRLDLVVWGALLLLINRFPPCPLLHPCSPAPPDFSVTAAAPWIQPWRQEFTANFWDLFPGPGCILHPQVFTPRPQNPSTDSCSALPDPRGPSAFGVYPGLLWVTPAS